MMKTWTSTITYSVFDMGRECETEEEYKEMVKQSFREEHNIKLTDQEITDVEFEGKNNGIETDMEYLVRKHKQHYKHLTWNEFIVNEKLECVHVALQEIQQEFNIPDDNSHLQDAFEFTESLREEVSDE